MSRLKQWTKAALLDLEGRIATAWRPERILVIHIAKTAGTSLRRMLQEEYGPRLVYPGDWHLERLPHGWYPLGSEMLRDHANLPPHNVLIGHFTAAMADMLPRRYQTATFLREPIQRSLSMLGHFSRTLNVPVPALIEDPAFMAANIADFQTRILGADGVCDPHQVDVVDDAVLARAVTRLETLNFVGLTERFAESCAVFDRRFRTHISKRIRREAVYRPEGGEFAEHVPRLEPFLRRDRILYDTAVARCDAGLGPKNWKGRTRVFLAGATLR
jgi:hypothetical protein